MHEYLLCDDYCTLVEKGLIINAIRKIGALVGRMDHYMLGSRKQNVVRFYMVLIQEGLEAVMMFDLYMHK